MTWQVVEAERGHVGVVFSRLRRGHRDCLLGVGLDQRRAFREFRKVFDDSAFRRSWIHHGEVVGIGGVTGSLLSPHGFVWLALTEDVIRFPREIIRESRRQLGEIMKTKTELATTILASDDVALRFCAFLGFHSNHEAAGRTWREQLREFQEKTPRIPVEQGFAIAVGFHKEAA